MTDSSGEGTVDWRASGILPPLDLYILTRLREAAYNGQRRGDEGSPQPALPPAATDAVREFGEASSAYREASVVRAGIAERMLREWVQRHMPGVGVHRIAERDGFFVDYTFDGDLEVADANIQFAHKRLSAVDVSLVEIEDQLGVRLPRTPPDAKGPSFGHLHEVTARRGLYIAALGMASALHQSSQGVRGGSVIVGPKLEALQQSFFESTEVGAALKARWNLEQRVFSGRNGILLASAGLNYLAAVRAAELLVPGHGFDGADGGLAPLRPHLPDFAAAVGRTESGLAGLELKPVNGAQPDGGRVTGGF